MIELGLRKTEFEFFFTFDPFFFSKFKLPVTVLTRLTLTLTTVISGVSIPRFQVRRFILLAFHLDRRSHFCPLSESDSDSSIVNRKDFSVDFPHQLVISGVIIPRLLHWLGGLSFGLPIPSLNFATVFQPDLRFE